jgi:hypothetical protein
MANKLSLLSRIIYIFVCVTYFSDVTVKQTFLSQYYGILLVQDSVSTCDFFVTVQIKGRNYKV